MKNIIAIIPARSGSKGIKNKNLKLLGGKPLLGLAVQQCVKSKLFSKIYLSTDSEKYAKIGKKFGPIEIILRPKKISSNISSDYLMIHHAIKNINIDYDFIAHIRPTSPLRKINQLQKAIRVFKRSNFSSLRLDFKGIYYMPGVIKAANIGDAAIIKTIIKILYNEGIKVISSIYFNPELSLKKGNYSKIKPNKKDYISIKKGTTFFKKTTLCSFIFIMDWFNLRST